MTNQSPYMTFTSKQSDLHTCARITADRLPNDSVAANVRKADTYCKDLHEQRAEALRILANIDSIYQDTWETVYKMGAGGEP